MTSIQPIPPAAQPFDWAVFLYLLLLPALALIAAGLFMVYGRRGLLNQQERNREDVKAAMRGDQPPATTLRTRLAAWRDSRTEPTRLVLGLAALFTGYHIAAYVLPPHILPFHVPWDRAWILALGVTAAVIASLAIDRLQR
ncbi:MAG TPA: hypothetical protein VK157_00060 [Phycisphaerales bacterium]|nr:hypothetical protein [Phycisphaerales bacterium]